MTSYIKTAAMITLCIFLPPLGWLFMYKYSTFDRKTNFILAAACLAFFIYANISAGNLSILGGDKSFEIRTTPEEFREKFNASAKRLAPNLGVTIDAPLTVDGKIFSHDLLRIDPKNNFDAGYIYAWLKSSLGQKILLTNSYGAVIEHIEPEHLEKIPIPDAPEDLKRRIHGLIVRSYDLRDESNALLDTAEKILSDALNLPPLEDFQAQKFFTVKLSNLRGRLDASFHAPIVQRIVEHLKAHAAEVTTVADNRISRAVILPGRFKRVYVDEGHGRIFIGGKQIGELDPSNKKYLSNIHHADRISAELELHENMTLITRSGTIGKVTLVPKHWDDWIASEHVIRITPASDDISGYLSLFLASDCGQVLIKRNTYGAVVDEIDDKQVRVLPVPLLRNVAAQSRINSMVLLANEKRFRAYLLEQEALKVLNDKILAVQ